MMDHWNHARGYDRDHSSSWRTWPFFTEKAVNLAGDDAASTPSDSPTCTGSSNSGLYSPTFSPHKWQNGAASSFANLKAQRSPEVQNAGKGRSFVNDRLGGANFTGLDESGLDRYGFLAEDEVIDERRSKRAGEGLEELEAYLAKQREHLAAAISAEWITTSTSPERKLKMESACHELVRRSFEEVHAAAEVKPAN
ncbi:hypothetical protein FOL47_006360 [Perkinsus chesapeaki]|uniref:Uncharacterized protein n=1 Tax=Perkinsus chesapeaki TaxID=330153 RepID=A0A7J6LSK9_PERCH|nr:hypothetical protein FOL47_006360 [Perkinsus chesapeaki]